MTLIELLIIIAIFGVLSTLANSWYTGYIETARVNNAIAQISALSLLVDDYILENDEPPDSLSDVANSNLIDPWGRPYEYLKIDLGSDDYAKNTVWLMGGGIMSVSMMSISMVSLNMLSSGMSEQDKDDRESDRENKKDSGSGGGGGSGSNGGGSNNDGGSSGNSAKGKARKDHSLVPLNTDYDLYSKGKDGQSRPPLPAPVSQDDVLRANNGGFIGLASTF